MLFETSRHRHRRQTLEAGFTDQWRDVLAANMAHWAYLDDDERQRLGARAVELLATKQWEAAHGFELTDEITMLIAAEAALIALELDADAFREVRAIVVHPTTMVMRGQHSQVVGVVSDDPMPILGQANNGLGPVMVAWDAASFQARHPDEGNNVVFHEFAHKLDMLTGQANGTPPMASAAAEAAWVEACTAAYQRVVDGHSAALRPYAGVNTAEFFAVATEVFFDTPTALTTHEPALYEVLADWYGQDPATRMARRR
jgi:Mlc titration factor MtfA (ptsG expression regulator)